MNKSPEVSLHRKFPREAPRMAPGIAAYGVRLWRQSAIDSLKKFDPRAQIRNPVMFVVWLGALVTASLTIDPGLFGPSSASAAYNEVVTIILLLTVWFANFAEALAEGRGKAKAASLRRTKTELMARRVRPPAKSSRFQPRPCARTMSSGWTRASSFRPTAK